MASSVILLIGAALVLTVSGLRCPQLDPESVCSAAREGFKYNDGCNGVECTGSGQYTTTMRWCPRPQSAEERRECRGRASAIFERLGPFSCSNLEAASVCSRRGSVFSYFDGCNRVTCEADGGYTSSFRMCPQADAEGAYCQFMESRLGEAARRRRRRR
ncbi:hypothetical protein BOX15_Mlig004023g2 [Macrostomum lignano]|uniref:Uncharacterized protein n=1 Tax=Macrostomum lignano TaxID=282301 RepID=A0A267GUP2_9PLAT|nr:hypothetical protein BOX15_Mlig004023g2 [Macrostomum lignano]